MKHRILTVAAALLTALASPAPAAAQLGAVLEWINGLSGPGLLRVGPMVTLAEIDDRNSLELTPLFTVHVDDRGNPDTDPADIAAFGVQGTLESILIGEGSAVELRSRIGFEFHRFSGEFDSFWAPAFPVFLALHFPGDTWSAHIGTGFNTFHFPDDAFDPWDTGVARDGFDSGWSVQAGIEVGGFRLFQRR